LKRDDDLIRELLFEIEAHDDAYFICADDKDSGDQERRRHYHLVLLTDAGMLKQSGRFGSTFRMTNSGHDFLGSIRNEGIWSKVKETIASTVGDATLGIMADIAKAYIKSEISNRIGKDL
jgi:hypothetical protein